MKNEKIQQSISLELLKEDAILTQMDQANTLREKFAFWAMCYVSFFTTLVILTLWLSATKCNKIFFIHFTKEFHLDSDVLIALLCSFTAQIIGVILAILIYLFPKKDYNL